MQLSFRLDTTDEAAACDRFDELYRRGVYNAFGFTPREWAAYLKTCERTGKSDPYQGLVRLVE